MHEGRQERARGEVVHREYRTAREALAVSKETGLLCTEAIWTRYMPSRQLINEVIASGEIGEVKSASANLCYPVSGKARMIDPACAGGALLDVGVYPLNFLDMAVGADHGRTLDHFSTSMVPYETGVDAQNSTTLYYSDGTMAVSTSSMLVASDRGGYVWGTEGYLEVTNINNPESIDIYGKDHKPVRSISVPPQLTGYEYEVAAAAMPYWTTRPNAKRCLMPTPFALWSLWMRFVAVGASSSRLSSSCPPAGGRWHAASEGGPADQSMSTSPQSPAATAPLQRESRRTHNLFV